jgi:hypothetical protein
MSSRMASAFREQHFRDEPGQFPRDVKVARETITSELLKQEVGVRLGGDARRELRDRHLLLGHT